MKTTFRTVFHELEDELMDIDLNTDKTADIDVEKIKGEVLMRIKENGTNNSNKKFSKRITFILVAAVILITGTIGAFATGSVQQIFGRLFRNGSKPDAMGLYSSKNVEVSTNDDNLNVNVLGVTGDGERLYSAIEITRKDGGAVIDEDYHTFSAYGNFNHFQTEYTNKDGNKMSVADTCTYQLDDNNRTLTIYLSSLSLSEQMEKGSVTGTLHSLDVFKIEQVLASMDLPEISHDTNPDDVKINFSDAELAEKRKQFGVTEEECISIDHDGKREYCKASQKNFAIDFTVSYDFDYSDEYFIKKELNSDSAKNILKADVQNIQLTVTPLGIYLDGENTDSSSFKEIDKNSTITLNDGTVYYLYPYEGHHDGLALNYSTVAGGTVYTQTNVIDTHEVKSVTINGSTIYP